MKAFLCQRRRRRHHEANVALSLFSFVGCPHTLHDRTFLCCVDPRSQRCSLPRGHPENTPNRSSKTWPSTTSCCWLYGEAGASRKSYQASLLWQRIWKGGSFHNSCCNTTGEKRPHSRVAKPATRFFLPATSHQHCVCIRFENGGQVEEWRSKARNKCMRGVRVLGTETFCLPSAEVPRPRPLHSTPRGRLERSSNPALVVPLRPFLFYRRFPEVGSSYSLMRLPPLPNRNEA